MNVPWVARLEERILDGMSTSLPVPAAASGSIARAGYPAWLDRALYPFDTKTFVTPDGALSYLDEGRGRPVLIVHGTPSWSFEWRAVVRALAKTHRVVAPDHLGFGLSDKPDRPETLRPEDHARRLAALVAALDLEDAILVGHDFGGPIGLGAALEAPNRFTGLVLSNTWMESLAHRADVRRLSAIVRSPFGRLLYRGLNASPRFILPAAFGDRRALSRDVHRHYLAPFPRWSERAAPWKLGVELAGSAAFYASIWDRRDALQHARTHVVWGEKDPTFRAPELARLRAGFPGADCTLAPESGHFTAEEAPDALIAAIRAV